MSLEDVIYKYGGSEVTAMEVYSDMFRLGQNMIQKQGEYDRNFKGNPLGYYKNQNEDAGHYRIMLDDSFEDVLKELQEADFSILNGITYMGKKNLQSRATRAYGLIFDIDGIDDKTLVNFFSGAKFRDVEKGIYTYPVPNYIALSGHGIHLYYIFSEPIALYPQTKLQLKELKYALTTKMWNSYTSTEKRVQYQGINQGFRVIGGKTKIDGVRVRAFKVRSEHYTVQELSLFVPDEYKIEQLQLFKESKFTLEEAKKKFPEWYESVIVRSEERQKWDLSKKVHGNDPYAIYNWWIRQIKSGATYHHRYFNIMCLAIYAIKCRKPFNELQRDAYELIPFLNDINKSEPFTKEDVDSALECYDLRYCTFPIKDIEKLSAIEIPKNKRNGRNREVHLMGARAIQEINDRANNTNWREGNGRPKAAETVWNWRENNPLRKKADCIRETGLSKPTVYKWWDYQPYIEFTKEEAEALGAFHEEALTLDDIQEDYLEWLKQGGKAD